MAQAFMVATVIMAVGQAYKAQQDYELERQRQRVLAAEKRNAELAALDEENMRLAELSEVNADVIAMSGSIDPFSSPSLIAIRQANVKTAKKDLANIQQNRAVERARFAMEIAISKQRQRAAVTSGILAVGSTLLSGYATAQSLGGASTAGGGMQIAEIPLPGIKR